MKGSTNDTIQRRIGEKIRTLILASVADPWAPGAVVSIGQTCEPITPTGRRYVATASGTSGANEPLWPSAPTETLIADGTVVWTDAGVSPAALRVFYRGEPDTVPVRLYPFCIVFMRRKRVARGEDGYGSETGVRHWRHEGYVSVEALIKDGASLTPDQMRSADVASYVLVEEMAEAVVRTIEDWDPESDPVTNIRGETTTGAVFTDDVSLGIEARGDNVANRGNVAFHLYSREMRY